nr:ribonuclease H-like domain-containing protein [Tanacetum cinerariifolium]
MNSSYCVQNPPYKFKWTEKTVPVVKGIDNDIYSTIDACPNSCEMWKAIERLKQEWKRSVTLVKQSQELKTVYYHKLFDILKQHQNEFNEIRAERLACTVNPLALITQQQPVNHLTHYTYNSSTRSQQAATRNRGKAIINYPPLTYDQEPKMLAKHDASSKTNRAHQDNTLRINKESGYEDQRVVNVARARENACIQIQEVTPNATNNSGPIFDNGPLQKVQNDDDNIHVFANNKGHPEKPESEGHPKQPESVNDTYLKEQGDTKITIDSLGMSTNGETNNHDDNDLAREPDLLASLIDKLKYEIDDNKNHNKLLESSSKTLVDKLKDLKKSQAELDRYHDVNYASKVEINCAKAKDLEVAFRKSTCYVCDFKGNDLLTCSCRLDLYSITLQDITSPNHICLMAKATSSQAWLWHCRLSYLNFNYINLLSKNDIVIGLQ